MPSKGYLTMGEELENVAMRLPMSVLAQVDTHIDTLRQEAPWAKVGRSDALRDLVVRGLASLARRQPQRSTPQAQPALPLAPAPPPEPAPDPIQPTTRTRAKRTSHGLPSETLQQIAEERTHCEGLSLRDFAQRLHERGIYSATAQEGNKVPANPGNLREWLKQAREQGFL